MTADVDIRAGLAANLRDIAGLSVTTYIPGQVNAPAAFVTRRRTNYDATMRRGSDDFEYLVTVAVSWAEPQVAQAAMSAYLDTASATSIKAAVEAEPTLGGVVDFVRVTEAGEELIRVFGDVEYLTVEFVVEVTA